jgi:hypothetical protein
MDTQYKLARMVKIIGYTIMIGSFSLALAFVAMIF